jgi:ABC-type arginine transport system permease subunit
VSLEPGKHTIRGTAGNVTLVITRRGNIHMALSLHLISDYIDPVEVNLLREELRREVTITVRTEIFPTVPEIVTVLLTYSGSEDVILTDNEANITILKGMIL